MVYVLDVADHLLFVGIGLRTPGRLGLGIWGVIFFGGGVFGEAVDDASLGGTDVSLAGGYFPIQLFEFPLPAL
jgi:hypothetical protein